MAFFRVSSRGTAYGSYSIRPLAKWTTELDPPYIILVHGHYTSMADADVKYLPFARRFSDCTVVGFYWRASKSYFISKLTARSGTLSLSNFILQNYTRRELRKTTIIAHSMGCRLVLECLTQLARNPRAPVVKPRHVILWGAAVDRDEIARGEDYYAGTRLPRNVWVMYSRSDAVLQRFYPLGEFSRALGYAGPAGRVGRNVRPIDCTPGMGNANIDAHSKYWKSAAIGRMTRRIIETGRA